MTVAIIDSGLEADHPALLGRVVDLPLESLRVGLSVRFRPLVVGEQTMVGFGPA